MYSRPTTPYDHLSLDPQTVPPHRPATVAGFHFANTGSFEDSAERQEKGMWFGSGSENTRDKRRDFKRECEEARERLQERDKTRQREAGREIAAQYHMQTLRNPSMLLTQVTRTRLHL
jgi:hypothetical protein